MGSHVAHPLRTTDVVWFERMERNQWGGDRSLAVQCTTDTCSGTDDAQRTQFQLRKGTEAASNEPDTAFVETLAVKYNCRAKSDNMVEMLDEITVKNAAEQESNAAACVQELKTIADEFTQSLTKIDRDEETEIQGVHENYVDKVSKIKSAHQAVVRSESAKVSDADDVVKNREADRVGPAQNVADEEVRYEEEKAAIRQARSTSQADWSDDRAFANRTLLQEEAAHESRRTQDLQDAQASFNTAMNDCSAEHMERRKLVDADAEALRSIQPLLAKLEACRGGAAAGTAVKMSEPEYPSLVEAASSAAAKHKTQAHTAIACGLRVRTEINNRLAAKASTGRTNVLREAPDASDVTGQFTDWERRVKSEDAHTAEVYEQCTSAATNTQNRAQQGIQTWYAKAMRHSKQRYNQKLVEADGDRKQDMAELDARLIEKRAPLDAAEKALGEADGNLERARTAASTARARQAKRVKESADAEAEDLKIAEGRRDNELDAAKQTATGARQAAQDSRDEKTRNSQDSCQGEQTALEDEARIVKDMQARIATLTTVRTEGTGTAGEDKEEEMRVEAKQAAETKEQERVASQAKAADRKQRAERAETQAGGFRSQLVQVIDAAASTQQEGGLFQTSDTENLPTGFFGKAYADFDDAYAERASIMSLKGADELVKPVKKKMQDTVDAVKAYVENKLTGGLDASGLLSNLNYVSKMSSSIGNAFGNGGSEIGGLVNMALDTTPLSDLFEEELRIEELKDLMKRRLNKVLGVDEDEAEALGTGTDATSRSDEEDLMDAITSRLSPSKVQRVGNRALNLVRSAMFGNGDSTDEGSEASSLIEEGSDDDDADNRRCAEKCGEDYPGLGAFENRKDAATGKCTGCVSKKPAVVVSFNLGFDLIRAKYDSLRLGGQFELNAGFGLSIAAIFPLHCEVVYGGRDQDISGQDALCSKYAQEQGEIRPSPYFLFSLGNKVTGLSFTRVKKAILEQVKERKHRYWRKPQSMQAFLKSMYDRLGVDVSIGMMFDHTRATGGGWSIEIENPVDEWMQQTMDTSPNKLAKFGAALMPSSFSIALEDHCQAAGDGTRLGIKPNWGGDGRFQPKAANAFPDIDGFNVHWKAKNMGVPLGTAMNALSNFLSSQANGAAALLETQETEGLGTSPEIATVCGARPGAHAADQMPEYCCLSGAPESPLGKEIAEAEEGFPKRYHKFLLEMGSRGTIGDDACANKKLDEKFTKESSCTNLQPTCKAGGPGIVHANKANGVTVLLKDAVRYKPVFDQMLTEMTQHAAKDATIAVKNKIIGNKKRARCEEKIDMKYGCSDQYGVRQLTDVVRGSIIFKRESDICTFVKTRFLTQANNAGMLLSGTELWTVTAEGIDPKTGEAYKPATLEITNSKNRFHTNAEGMRDYLINVRMKIEGDAYGHVAELQVHHNEQVLAKKDFHCVYSYLRRIDEARKFEKKIPFGDGAEYEKYRIDHIDEMKGESTLDAIWTKWVQLDAANCDKNRDGSVDADSLCMKDSDKDGKPDGITASEKTLGYWNTLIKPYLRPEYQLDIPALRTKMDGRKFKNTIKRTGGQPVEHQIYKGLKEAMVEAYDTAAFDIYDDRGTKGGMGTAGSASCTGKIKLEYTGKNHDAGKGPQDWVSDGVTTSHPSDFYNGACSTALQNVGKSCSKVELAERSWARCKEYYEQCVGTAVPASGSRGKSCEAAFKEQCTPGGKPEPSEDCNDHRRQCEGEGFRTTTCNGPLRELGPACSRAHLSLDDTDLQRSCETFYDLCALEICDIMDSNNGKTSATLQTSSKTPGRSGFIQLEYKPGKKGQQCCKHVGSDSAALWLDRCRDTTGHGSKKNTVPYEVVPNRQCSGRSTCKAYRDVDKQQCAGGYKQRSNFEAHVCQGYKCRQDECCEPNEPNEPNTATPQAPAVVAVRTECSTWQGGCPGETVNSRSDYACGADAECKETCCRPTKCSAFACPHDFDKRKPPKKCGPNGCTEEICCVGDAAAVEREALELDDEVSNAKGLKISVGMGWSFGYAFNFLGADDYKANGGPGNFDDNNLFYKALFCAPPEDVPDETTRHIMFADEFTNGLNRKLDRLHRCQEGRPGPQPCSEKLERLVEADISCILENYNLANSMVITRSNWDMVARQPVDATASADMAKAYADACKHARAKLPVGLAANDPTPRVTNWTDAKCTAVAEQLFKSENHLGYHKTRSDGLCGDAVFYVGALTFPGGSKADVEQVIEAYETYTDFTANQEASALLEVEAARLGRGDRSFRRHWASEDVEEDKEDDDEQESLLLETSAASSAASAVAAAAAADVGDIARDLFFDYLRTGELRLPFCIGKGTPCDKLDVRRAVAGSALASLNVDIASGDSMVETSKAITVDVPVIKLGAIAHLMTDAIYPNDPAKAEDVLVDMGAVAELGIVNAVLSLEQQGEEYSLALKGSPDLGAAIKCDDVFTCEVKKVLDEAKKIVLQQKVTLGRGEMELETKVGSVPLVVSGPKTCADMDDVARRRQQCAPDPANKNVLTPKWPVELRDHEGNGPSFFMRVKYFQDPPMPPDTTLGITLGVTVTPWREDKNAWEDKPLVFYGELGVMQGAGPTEVQGSLQMLGSWWNTMGIPFVHVQNAKAGLSAQFVGATLVLSAYEIGGGLCLGVERACRNKRPGDNFIVGHVYTKVDQANVENNYFMAMVSDVTFRKALGILSDAYGAAFRAAVAKLPADLLDSGVLGFQAGCTGAQLNDPGAHPDCFVRYSNSPLQQQEIAMGEGKADIIVDEGLSFAGRISVMGWQAKVKATFSPSTFYCEAGMDAFKVTVGGVDLLVVSGADAQGRQDASKGPELLIDVKTLPITSALVRIDGYASIPFLGLTASASIGLSGKGAHLVVKRDFFGLARSSVAVDWGWDVSKPDLGFAVAVDTSEMKKTVGKVTKFVQDIIDNANKFMCQLVQRGEDLAYQGVNKICNWVAQYFVPERSSKARSDLANGCKDVGGAILKPFFKVLRGVMNLVQQAIQVLIDAATAIANGAASMFSLEVLSFSGRIGSADKMSGAAVKAKLRFIAFGVDSGLLAPELNIGAGVAEAIFVHVRKQAANLDNLLEDVKNKLTGADRFDSGGIDDIIECITAAINGDFDGACKRLKNKLVDGAKSKFSGFDTAPPPSNVRRNMCKRWYPNIKEAKKDKAACEDDEECESGKCVHVRGVFSGGGNSRCSPRSGFAEGHVCYAGEHEQCAGGLYCKGTGDHAKCAKQIADYGTCPDVLDHTACAGHGAKCTLIRAGWSVCKPGAGFADGKKCWATRHEDCAGGYCKGIGDAATCRTCNVKQGDQWSHTVRGTCAWGCCDKGGYDAGWDRYCSTGITHRKRWSWTEHGTCKWGCCHNTRDHRGGTDRGWSHRCARGKIRKGHRWAYTWRGKCQWGCCHGDGRDRGWSHKCTGVGHNGNVKVKDIWGNWVNGKCFWGCCNYWGGTDRGYSRYCAGTGHGGAVSKHHSGTCRFGCCHSNGNDAGWERYCAGTGHGGRYQRAHAGSCAWGCCNDKGHDRGWSHRCNSPKISKGAPWRRVDSGKCFWKCCNNGAFVSVLCCCVVALTLANLPVRYSPFCISKQTAPSNNNIQVLT